MHFVVLLPVLPKRGEAPEISPSPQSQQQQPNTTQSATPSLSPSLSLYTYTYTHTPTHSTSTTMSDKPRVLILGGTGFIGRHLVKYLIDNDLASKIRVADKSMPQLAYLTPEFKKYYDREDIVEFKQANLSNPAHIKRAFTDESGDYTFVVNLAAETRYGQEEGIYKQMVYELSVNCAQEALQRNVQKYIEFSTAQVYEPGKKPSQEKDKQKPWTKLAKCKQQAEEALKKMTDLPLIIVRPSIVYGPGDLNGLAPRIICAATYTHTKEKMKLLWTGDLRINCVHVTDVARAIWHLFLHGNKGDVYNLSDKSDLSQKKFGEILTSIFGIQVGYFGSLLSTAAQLKMKDAVETANDAHMEPWSLMCKNSGIASTPLSPYIDIEVLYNTSLSVDGSAIEKATGFKYEKTEITKELVEEEIKYYQDLKLFPTFTKL